MPRIYGYLDYRAYCADLFAALKRANPRFSRREFARIAGSTSPNYLQFIGERRLHLSDSARAALCTFLGFSRRERAYFAALVAFDHARTHSDKDRHFQHIIAHREYGPFRQVQENQYRYLSHWYMPVIRELATSSLYPGNPRWIADQMVPSISESRVRRGIALLQELDLIRYNREREAYEQTATVLSTPSEVLSHAVITYYKGVLALGREAVERFGPGERDIRGVTVGISRQTYTKLKKQLEACWQQVMASAAEPQEIERVYHVGLLLFPLSKENKP